MLCITCVEPEAILGKLTCMLGLHAKKRCVKPESLLVCAQLHTGSSARSICRLECVLRILYDLCSSAEGAAIESVLCAAASRAAATR